MTIQRVFADFTLCTLGALAPMTALGALTPISEAADAPAIVEQLTEEEVAGQESGKTPPG